MHIRFDKRETHFFHRGIHVCFGELATAAESVKDLV
jgi:hypothetical protein